MKWILFLSIASSLAACERITEDSARHVGCARLDSLTDGPTLKGEELCKALVISSHENGLFLVEFHDEQKRKRWAVVVGGSGASEISTMDDDER